jgi:hypothetical protein
MMTLERTLKQIVDHVLCGSNDVHVVVGPLAWQPSDGTASKSWYFVVATSEEGRGFRCDQITVALDDREGCRTSFILALASRPPCVIHDMADELSAAKLCEMLWPGERITKIREQIEAERRARGACYPPCQRPCTPRAPPC